MIHFAVTVADLPDNVNYTIYGDDEYAKFSKILLKKFGHTVFDDVSSMPLNAVNLIVVSSPQWPVISKELSDYGREVIIVLHPDGNIWSYYCLTKEIIADVQIEGKTKVSVKTKNFYNRLAQQTSIIKEDDGRFKTFDSHYHPNFEELFKKHKEEVDSVAHQLSDAESRGLFNFLITAKFEDYVQYYLPKMFSHIQYMDYINLGPGDVVINGGVETGFEIPYFTAMMGGKGEIHCFDPLGFSLLADYIKPCVDAFPETIINHQLALMDYNGEIELGTEGPQAEIKIVQLNKGLNKTFSTKFFPCVTIDSFVENRKLSRIDLIKLDLEGADAQALNGAMKTILKFRPQLALSIYHFPEDLFQIPYFFMNRLSEYYYFLGHYSFARWETILYAIPREKLFPKKLVCQL